MQHSDKYNGLTPIHILNAALGEYCKSNPTTSILYSYLMVMRLIKPNATYASYIYFLGMHIMHIMLMFTGVFMVLRDSWQTLP